LPSNVHETPREQCSDFSLVTGGPLYQLWRRSRLCGDEMQWVRRRIIVMVLLAWVPLLLLSMAEGHAWGSAVALTFVKDLETHAKLLIALPLLIAGEVMVHKRLPFVVRQFLERGMIPDSARTRFDAALASAVRLRNSVIAELLLVLVVYLVGIGWIWRMQLTLDISSWYGASTGGSLQLSRAGWWAACVSLPIVQFLLLRWYFRLFIWGRFLWQVSRMKLNLVPTHADGMAGLHFLGHSRRAYTLLLLAQGAVLAGMVADRIFYTGATLASFKVELLTTVAVMLLVVLGPLLVFAPTLRATRRTGMEEFGALGQRYSGEFERKWFRGGAAPGEALVGTPDIRSLADLRNSFLVVKGIGGMPFTLMDVLELALITLAPVAPLLLTTFSVEQLLTQVLKVLF
jgi:hypothetical protein